MRISEEILENEARKLRTLMLRDTLAGLKGRKLHGFAMKFVELEEENLRLKQQIEKSAKTFEWKREGHVFELSGKFFLIKLSALTWRCYVEANGYGEFEWEASEHSVGYGMFECENKLRALGVASECDIFVRPEATL